MGLIVGRSSASLSGINVIPGVIDSDYTGEIQIIVSPSIKTQQIFAGQRIAQLLLLPYYRMGKELSSEDRKERGFGSSDMAFWVQEITKKRPLKTLKINGKNIQGLLDTGADASCIAGKDWPAAWPTEHTENMLTGLGTAPAVARSAQILTWENVANRQAGTFCPYVILGLPISLWGRDILTQMGMLLYSPDNWVSSEMIKMGYDPDKGLGKNQEGQLFPIVAKPKIDKCGIGYPNL